MKPEVSLWLRGFEQQPETGTSEPRTFDGHHIRGIYETQAKIETRGNSQIC